MGFLGAFADLSSYRVGDFKVEAIAGRDSVGAPKWRVVCKKCGQEQVLSHSKIATVIESKAPGNLTCVNPSCPLSKSQDKQSESFADLRKREHRAAEQATKQAEQEAAQRQEQETKQRAVDAKIAALKTEYRFFWNHQIRTEIAEDKIIGFRRWQQLDPGTRQLVLERIKMDPDLMVEGL